MTEFTTWRSLVDGAEITAIPDSVLLQYFATQVTGGDTTWPDDNGVKDMSLTGDETDTTLSDGSEALSFDTSDVGTIDPPTALEGDGLQEFAFEFAIQTTQTDQGQIIRADDGDQQFVIWQNIDEDFNNDTGNIHVRLRDDTGAGFEFACDDPPNTADENRHNVSVDFPDTTSELPEIIIDGDVQNLTFRDDTNPTDFVDWVDTFDLFSDVSNEWQGDVGAVRFHSTSIAEQTIDVYE